jgi:hypothetical protein
MCDNERDPRNQILHMKQIQAEGLELFIRKNADYGDSYKQYGLIGVLVRLQDKINRCLNITKNGISVKDESLRDTLIDLHNYAAMALMESESEPTVPNLPSKIISSNIPSMTNYEPFSEPVLNMHVRRSLSDPPLQAMTPVMRASMSEMDRCINLR